MRDGLEAPVTIRETAGAGWRSIAVLFSAFLLVGPLPVAAAQEDEPAAASSGRQAAPEGVRAADIPTAAWERIRKTVKEGRYRVRRLPDDRSGYRAYNPAQNLRARFDAAGTRIAPAEASEDWQLRPVRYGLAGALHSLERVDPRGSRTDPARIEYRRDGITEWWVNRTRGLQQGFTVPRRPRTEVSTGAAEQSAAEGILVIEMRSSGTLIADQREEGSRIVLRDGVGVARLQYSGLVAWDADGRTLPSSMHVRGGEIRLEVDVREARYPVTIDPFTQTAYLKASNAGPVDVFGISAAISGDTVVVGAFREDSGGLDAGAAYVFERNHGGADNWGEVAFLQGSNTGGGDEFGRGVGIDGDTVIVGALREDSGGFDAGAAYVFERNHPDPNAWGEVAFLTASNGEAGDQFGKSVAISGDTAIVGAWREDSGGAEGDNGATLAGAAYVFERNYPDPNTWGQVAYVKASNAGRGDEFGWSVRIDGDTALVGARREAGGAGAAYVYERDAGGGDHWGQVALLKASNAGAGDEFGFALGIDGDRAVVGARFEDSVASDSGAAYVYDRNAGGTGNWGEVALLKASNAGAGDEFGVAATIGGSIAIIGARGEDSAAGAGQDDGSAESAGAAYVFEKDQGGTDNWGQADFLKAANADAGDQFGWVTAMSGSTVVVTANVEQAAAGSGPSDNSAEDAGAAYVFDDVASNSAPIADAGEDLTEECVGPNGTPVTLVGNLSSDPDGDPLTFTWQGPFPEGGGTVHGMMPRVTLERGAHTIILTVMDTGGLTAEDEVVVTVEDTTAPVIEKASASPDSLWPPNHQMVDVTISVDVSDLCASSDVACRIVAVTSDEAVDGTGDGDTAPDWQITGDLTLKLRAERSGRGNGRTYTVSVRCSDPAGNHALTEIEISVPKNRGRGGP